MRKFRNSNRHIYIWMPLFLAIAVCIGIVLGLLFSRSGTYLNNRTSIKGTEKLNSVFKYISDSYVDSVSLNDLSERAIPAVLSGLDPHSIYISAKSMALTGSELDGHFSGIGIEFMIEKDSIVVVNVTPQGAAETQGILSGDRIVYANDSLFVGSWLTNEKVFSNLRGKKGSKINLRIKRRGIPKLLNFTLTRADVPVKSVDAFYKLGKDIGYIKVSRFGSTTYDEFISAIATLKSSGCQSFIIDLQDNSGGYLGTAVNMINEFLPKGKMIVYTKGRDRSKIQDAIGSDGTGSCQNNQIVVLIDEGSASASEIFSGAIQDNDRGLIVGRRSFGKGLVQTQKIFPDGSAMRLTIARYYTPSGRCIQKKYEKGDIQDYEMDLINRYKRGEFEHKDSIKLNNMPLFHTSIGRPVYGGGGILSDIFVPRDTTGINSYYMSIVNKGILKEYAFNFTEDNKAKLLSFKNWKKAKNYLSQQPLVSELVNYAFKEKKIRPKTYLIQESHNLLKTQLEAIIIRNVYGDNAFYQVLQENDKILSIAVDLLQKKLAMPQSLAAERYKGYTYK